MPSDARNFQQTLLLHFDICAYLFSSEEGSCYVFSTRNNCCKFLACDAVIFQSVIKPCHYLSLIFEVMRRKHYFKKVAMDFLLTTWSLIGCIFTIIYSVTDLFFVYAMMRRTSEMIWTSAYNAFWKKKKKRKN